MSHQIHIAKKWTITHVRSTNSISHALLTFGLFYNYWFIGFKLHFYRENIDPSIKYKLICNNFRIWQRKYIGVVCWVYLLGMMVIAAFCRYRKKVAKQVI